MLVVVEHLNDWYLMDHKDSKSWDYFVSHGDHEDEEDLLVPINNGFGGTEHGKLFVLWMHF